MENDKGQAKALVQDKPLLEQHKLIAYWAVHNVEPEEIAKRLEYSISTVKTVLKDKKVKLFIEKVKFHIYGENPALHLKDCAKKAVVVAEEIMMSKKTKDHVRLLAAQDFMNREFGKPGIDDGMVEGTVRKILQMLQKPKEEEKNTPEDIEDAEFKDVGSETRLSMDKKEADPLDAWIDENLK